MGTQPRSVKVKKADGEAARVREEIAATRDQMGRTLDEIHGKFNPTVLKEQALEQFHDAKDTIKAEMRMELENAKLRMRQEVGEAKNAAYDATIGKVEHMVSNASSRVRETGTTVYVGLKSNPIPVAIAGLGIAWLVMNMRSASNGRGVRVGDGRTEEGAMRRAAERIGQSTSDYAKAAQ